MVTQYYQTPVSHWYAADVRGTSTAVSVQRLNVSYISPTDASAQSQCLGCPGGLHTLGLAMQNSWCTLCSNVCSDRSIKGSSKVTVVVHWTALHTKQNNDAYYKWRELNKGFIPRRIILAHLRVALPLCTEGSNANGHLRYVIQRAPIVC
jgi:hypothetical protein